MMDDELVRVMAPSTSSGDGYEVGAGEMPSDYLLMRRELLAIEMRWIEEELLRRGEIRRRLVSQARAR